MTSDSRHFPPLTQWLNKGYASDVYGRFIGPDGDECVPLFEGRMIGQHDFSQKGWVSGKGRTAVWEDVPFENKRIAPQYLMQLSTLEKWPKANAGIKLAMMDVSSSTNTRSMVATATSFFPFGHSAPVLTVGESDFKRTLVLSAILNSFTFDFAVRPRVSGVHLTWFVLEECPLPKTSRIGKQLNDRCVAHSARLAFVHRRFAPEWLTLRNILPAIGHIPWKKQWAVTETDRLRLRIEIESFVADIYGLEPDDLDWIVRDDPSDPKGFYRVDRALPFRERLTGLAAAAFRAYKDDKWTAESSADLSNDEFFDIIGIPEMTNAEAGKAKGESGPLILKRDGCHVWKPENFPEDDPRHGWTWDDCWNDAVALLGSEDAVREYIEGKPDEPEEESEHTGPKDLFGDAIPVKPKQKKMF